MKFKYQIVQDVATFKTILGTFLSQYYVKKHHASVKYLTERQSKLITV